MKFKILLKKFNSTDLIQRFPGESNWFQNRKFQVLCEIFFPCSVMKTEGHFNSTRPWPGKSNSLGRALFSTWTALDKKWSTKNDNHYRLVAECIFSSLWVVFDVPVQFMSEVEFEFSFFSSELQDSRINVFLVCFFFGWLCFKFKWKFVFNSSSQVRVLWTLSMRILGLLFELFAKNPIWTNFQSKFHDLIHVKLEFWQITLLFTVNKQS